MVGMIWEGLDVVKQGRNMLGATDPLQSLPGTIRGKSLTSIGFKFPLLLGDFCLQAGRNIIHGSDSVESANREISHWFKKDEIIGYDLANKRWIYE